MNLLRITLGLGATLLISACGGSGTSESPSFSSMQATGNQLIAKYETTPATAVEDMPQTGSATYRGIAAYSSEYSNPGDIEQYATTLSQLELNANFATSSMTGRAYNFKNVDPNVTIDGQIDVNGTISGNTFGAGVNGTTKEARYGQSANVTYNGTVNGEFLGSDAKALYGNGAAVGSAPGYDPQPVWFVWGAEK